MNNHGAVIVSWDFNDKDRGVLIVGKQLNNHMDVLNVFTDDEAVKLYKKLTTKQGDK